MTSPANSAVSANSGSSKISTLCWIPASWLWNRIVNASPAGTVRLIGSKAMLNAASATTGRSPPPGSSSAPPVTARAMPPASIATPAVTPSIAPRVERRTCLRPAAIAAVTTTPPATTIAVTVAAVGLIDRRILEKP